MASMAIVNRWKRAMTSLNNDSMKSITTFPFLSQEPQLAEAPPLPSTPLPPNPASGSPLYNENWRNPTLKSPPSNSQSLITLGFAHPPPDTRIQAYTKTLDVESMMNVFADWMTSQRWIEMKQMFESWIRSLDKSGKPNKPDVNLYNHYLRANFMIGAPAGELLDLVAQMEDYGIQPNTASYNLVLKSMREAREVAAAEKLLERMILIGKESKKFAPDDESFDLVVGMMLQEGQIDTALKFIDLTLKSGYMLSMKVFGDCVRSCINSDRLDALVSIIQRCKKMDQNKALCPPWNQCIYIANYALQSDNSQLAYYALEFMAKWITRGEKVKPPLLLSVDEGLVVSALGTAGRTYSSSLLDASWLILKLSLREKKIPNPETYLAKIYALASLGNLPKAFNTLKDFETAYGDTNEAEDLLSPFTTLHPLVLASSKNGFTTLDTVYYELENLSKTDNPYKSVGALNCIIVGCANTWDVERAYQTFNAIDSAFGLSPNIHSYNGLICAFGKLRQRDAAVKVFEHFKSLGVKPNAKTYSLLVDSHLIERDQKSALSTIEEMISEGFEPTKEILKKVRRRCSREMDYESDDRVDELAKRFKIRLGTENRRAILFNLEFEIATD